MRLAQVSVPADHIELLDDTGARLNDPSAAAALFGEQYEVWVYAAVVSSDVQHAARLRSRLRGGC